MNDEYSMFLADIQTGQYDDQLDELRAALDYRERRLRKRLLTKLNPGETIRFASNIRPKYLAGLTATVVDVNETKEEVTLTIPDEPRYRRYAGSGIRCASSLIERMPA